MQKDQTTLSGDQVSKSNLDSSAEKVVKQPDAPKTDDKSYETPNLASRASANKKRNQLE